MYSKLHVRLAENGKDVRRQVCARLWALVWIRGVGFEQSLDCPCEFVGIEGKSRCLILSDQADVRLQLFNQPRLGDGTVCLKKPRRDYRRDT